MYSASRLTDLGGAAMAELPFKVLGWCPDRKVIWYQHRQTGQIASITPSANATPLLKLAPASFWEKDCKGERDLTDWTKAASKVIESANNKGVFCAGSAPRLWVVDGWHQGGLASWRSAGGGWPAR